MGVPGLIGVLERVFGNDEWIKHRTTLQDLADRADINGKRKIIAVDAMNFLFYLAGLKDTRGLNVELAAFCQKLKMTGMSALFIFDNKNLSDERKRRAQVRKAQRKDALTKLQNISYLDSFEKAKNAQKYEVLRTRTICVTQKEVSEAREILEKSGICSIIECVDEADRYVLIAYDLELLHGA